MYQFFVGFHEVSFCSKFSAFSSVCISWGIILSCLRCNPATSIYNLYHFHHQFESITDLYLIRIWIGPTWGLVVMTFYAGVGTRLAWQVSKYIGSGDCIVSMYPLTGVKCWIRPLMVPDSWRQVNNFRLTGGWTIPTRAQQCFRSQIGRVNQHDIVGYLKWNLV